MERRTNGSAFMVALTFTRSCCRMSPGSGHGNTSRGATRSLRSFGQTCLACRASFSARLRSPIRLTCAINSSHASAGRRGRFFRRIWEATMRTSSEAADPRRCRTARGMVSSPEVPLTLYTGDSIRMYTRSTAASVLAVATARITCTTLPKPTFAKALYWSGCLSLYLRVDA